MLSGVILSFCFCVGVSAHHRSSCISRTWAISKMFFFFFPFLFIFYSCLFYYSCDNFSPLSSSAQRNAFLIHQVLLADEQVTSLHPTTTVLAQGQDLLHGHHLKSSCSPLSSRLLNTKQALKYGLNAMRTPDSLVLRDPKVKAGGCKDEAEELHRD